MSKGAVMPMVLDIAVIEPPERGPGTRPRITSPACWTGTLPPLWSSSRSSSRSPGRVQSSNSQRGGISSGAERRTYAWLISTSRRSSSSAS
ncbi:hypothetical protein ACODT5_01065 [Streptomyces sp. 5.8]|uniref:hypothetical protein n=1 Tax=Streptomyces sp. 5.8 TaxID=3406571 RepID=UPI003BB585E7